MSELNGGITGIATEGMTPGYGIKLCSFAYLARCPICSGDFQTTPGFSVALDAPRPDAANGVATHRGGFLCPACVEREVPYLVEACELALKGFGRHAQEKAERRRREEEAKAYVPPPPPPPPVPVRAALQKLEKAVFERDGRIKELEAKLEAATKKKWF